MALNDDAIDAATEAEVLAFMSETDGRGLLHRQGRKLMDGLSVKERARAEANLSRRIGAIQAKALLADPDHPGDEGKKAEALLKADESTRRMDARQGYNRPTTEFVSGPSITPEE